MSYYGYHATIKKRIRTGELIDYYFTDKYRRIGRAMVLVFSTEPMVRPIRPERWGEYKGILERSMKHEKHRHDETGG